MAHFDHVCCVHHRMTSIAELYGHIDLGSQRSPHLSRISISLRRGREPEDLETVIHYLVKNRSRILKSFSESEKSEQQFEQRLRKLNSVSEDAILGAEPVRGNMKIPKRPFAAKNSAKPETPVPARLRQHAKLSRQAKSLLGS